MLLKGRRLDGFSASEELGSRTGTNCAKATGYARAIQLDTKDQERWCHRGQRNNCDEGRIAWSCYRGDNLCCIGTDLIFNSVGGEKQHLQNTMITSMTPSG
jgi:hypothetical protein